MGVDRHEVGDLAVIEPGTLAEQVIDTHVTGLERDDADGSAVVYAVPDGGRAGLWLAKLAPD